MGLIKLLDGVQVAAVICNQWGDSGKGKFSDFFASQWADVVARGIGGDNAGHTVNVNGVERIFHILPSGITHDERGVISVLGNGMVINLEVLCKELDELTSQGLRYANLRISQDAHVIMPWHIARDKARHESQLNGGIGSTGRGIGPCYTDKIARRGIRVIDLFNVDIFARKIEAIKEFYSEQEIVTSDVIEKLRPIAKNLDAFIGNTTAQMHDLFRRGKKILLEGAQGLLLSSEHGTYPYVTSSDCSLNGTASGVGLPASVVDLPLGIVKFPFMTRVGAGPFPTELGGRRSEEYCAEGRHGKEEEARMYGGRVLEMMNSPDDFERGIGIRMAAGEYGASTGRPRRVGWTDAVAARYAVGINGPLMILTKVDSLAGSDGFEVCYGYDSADGKGPATATFPRDEKSLRNVKPRNRRYGGYGEIGGVREYEDLPENLTTAIREFEEFTHGKVVVVSVGAERDATIVRD